MIAESKRTSVTLETLPILSLEKRIERLSLEDFICLHVTSKSLFLSCNNFIQHGRRSCEVEVSSLVIEVHELYSLVPCSERRQALRDFYRDAITCDARRKHEKFHVVTLNTGRLRPVEIKYLISHYKNSMSYLFIRHKRGKIRYRPTIQCHVGFNVLKRFYQKRNINYRLVLDFLKSLATNTKPWIHSCPELNGEPTPDWLTHAKYRALRRFASEVRLRDRLEDANY